LDETRKRGRDGLRRLLVVGARAQQPGAGLSQNRAKRKRTGRRICPAGQLRGPRRASIRDAGDIVDERGAPDRDSTRVVESAPSGRNPRGLGDTDNIAPSGR
jgi:hypothetical protein